MHLQLDELCFLLLLEKIVVNFNWYCRILRIKWTDEEQPGVSSDSHADTTQPKLSQNWQSYCYQRRHRKWRHRRRRALVGPSRMMYPRILGAGVPALPHRPASAHNSILQTMQIRSRSSKSSEDRPFEAAATYVRLKHHHVHFHPGTCWTNVYV